MAEPGSWLPAEADPVTATKTKPASGFFGFFSPTSGHSLALSVSLKPLSEELEFTTPGTRDTVGAVCFGAAGPGCSAWNVLSSANADPDL